MNEDDFEDDEAVFLRLSSLTPEELSKHTAKSRDALDCRLKQLSSLYESTELEFKEMERVKEKLLENVHKLREMTETTTAEKEKEEENRVVSPRRVVSSPVSSTRHRETLAEPVDRDADGESRGARLSTPPPKKRASFESVSIRDRRSADWTKPKSPFCPIRGQVRSERPQSPHGLTEPREAFLPSPCNTR